MDYKKLGLKVGLEIHQQLDTHKLFCNCPSTIREEEPDFTVERKLRSVVGETGEVDIAAAHEQVKGKTFIYEGYTDTTCLVELDEEPIQPMNKEALDITLQVAKMIKAQIIDQIQVMRKIVVDGSNTSGFQRTALVAINGKIKTDEGEIDIPTISVEEDACRIIDRNEDVVFYRLDRLGIPLIELGTKPQIHSPKQAQEVARYLGMVLRSTGRAKRGLGTIRQDVNVSIKGGERIEIKGAQDLKTIPQLVEFEMQRQQTLLGIKEELPKKIKFSDEKVDISDTFNITKSKVISSALKKQGVVLALKLPGFAGFLGRELQPDKRLGTEFSGRAKVKAGVSGIFHSDELPNYGITDKDVGKIKQTLGCKDKDAFVLVADQPRKAELALDAVLERAKETLEGVPREVRRAKPDGTTSYLRPIPGAARMYPETDSPPVTPDTKKIKVPELLKEKAERYKEKHKIGHDLANLLTKQDKHDVFEEFCAKFKEIKPAFIAETMLTAKKQIKKQFNIEVEPTHNDFEEVFTYLNKGKITKNSVLDILKQLNEREIKDAIADLELMSDADLEKEIKQLITKNKTAKPGAIMGQVMAKYKGKVDGKKAMELIQKHLK